MKTAANITTTIATFAMALGLACSTTPLAAQLTPVPDHFTDWTGKVDNDFFNPGNWSTGVVPGSPVDAVRLPGDPSTPNKHIVANYSGTGDKTIQLYSIQTGANKIYTLEFSGNDNGWLIINPIGRGFTFNGIIGTTPQLGESVNINYPQSEGDESTRLAAYYILHKNTRITFQGSTAGTRVAENGLATGIFTLKDNARIDLTQIGANSFVYQNSTGIVTYAANRVANVYIGGLLETGPNTDISVGGRNIILNNKMTTGQVSIMGGLFRSDPQDADARNSTCDVYGDITRMTGQVNFSGDGRAQFRIRSSAQYLVEGVHNGGIRVWSNGVLGGGGIINGAITVDIGGLLTPGQRGSTVGNSPDTPLTINATNFALNGSLGFDLVTATVHDRLTVNLSGTMTIRSPQTVSATDINSTYASLVISMADTFPRVVRKPLTYELMSVNLDVAASGTNVRMLGDFQNVTLPASQSLKTTMEWKSETEFNYALNQDMEMRRKLFVTVEQMPFASPANLDGRYLVAAQRVDEIYKSNDPLIQTQYEPIFEALNRQPSLIQYRAVLDQLTPSTYQAWFPSGVVRTNSMVQSLEDRMYQDAAYKRKKGSLQLFLDGYRQESSSAKNDEAAYSNYGTIGTVVGADYAFGENFVAGGFLAYDTTDFDMDTDGGSSDVASYTAGLKARYNTGNFQANLTGFYGTDDYTSTRSVALTQLGAWANADTNGTRLGAAASIAYTFKLPWFEVTPVAGAQVLSWKVDAFQERNANEANLYVYSQNQMSLQGKLGIRIAQSYALKHGFLRPYIHYSMLHEFEDDERWIKADLFGKRMSVQAPDINGNGYRLDLGLDWNVTEKLRIELRYQSEYRSAAKESVGVRGGVNYTF